MVPEDSKTPNSGDAEHQERRIHPFLIVLALLLVLAFGLGGWAWFGREIPPQEMDMSETSPTAVPVPTDITDIPGDGFGLVLGPATPWAIPGGPGEIVTIESPTIAPPTATPANIQLFGPPSGSVYRLDDVISFYWSAPVALAAGEQFIVYLNTGEERIALGTIVEPNLGQGYQLQASVDQFIGQAGTYSWQVVLEKDETGVMIGQSDLRSFMIVQNN